MTVASLVQDWSKTSEKIEARSKDLTPRIVFLTLIALPFFLIFFIACFAWKVVWTVITWIWSAGIEGWDTAKKIQNGDPL